MVTEKTPHIKVEKDQDDTDFLSHETIFLNAAEANTSESLLLRVDFQKNGLLKELLDTKKEKNRLFFECRKKDELIDKLKAENFRLGQQKTQAEEKIASLLAEQKETLHNLHGEKNEKKECLESSVRVGKTIERIRESVKLAKNYSQPEPRSPNKRPIKENEQAKVCHDKSYGNRSKKIEDNSRQNENSRDANKKRIAKPGNNEPRKKIQKLDDAHREEIDQIDEKRLESKKKIGELKKNRNSIDTQSKPIENNNQPEKKCKSHDHNQPKNVQKADEPGNGRLKKKCISRKIRKSEPEKSDSYEVESIVDHCVQNKKRLFRIRWKNFEAEDDTWQQEGDLNCPEILRKYWASFAKK